MDSISFLDSTGATKYVRGFGAGTIEDPISFTKTVLPVIVNADNMILDYLEDTGSNDMTVDGSVTPVSFIQITTVPADKTLYVARLLMFLEDTTAFSSEKFAGITALTNGIDIKLNGDTIINLKDNIDIIVMAYDSDGQVNMGKTDRTMTVRWTFTKFTGNPFGVAISEGNTFEVVINDDLTGLSAFRMRIEGLMQDANDA